MAPVGGRDWKCLSARRCLKDRFVLKSEGQWDDGFKNCWKRAPWDWKWSDEFRASQNWAETLAAGASGTERPDRVLQRAVIAKTLWQEKHWRETMVEKRRPGCWVFSSPPSKCPWARSWPKNFNPGLHTFPLHTVSGRWRSWYPVLSQGRPSLNAEVSTSFQKNEPCF